MRGKKLIVSVLLAVLVLLGCYFGYERRHPLVYQEHLEDTAATVDGAALTLQELAFYILYEEGQIEQQAKLYNSDNTRDYWNLHVDGIFVRESAKETILEMAIHDCLLYQLAREQGLFLTQEERVYADNMQADFWMDLLDGQQEKIGVSDEYINGAMEKMALAQKYQRQLAEEAGDTVASYNWEGYGYRQLRQQHDVRINKRVWDRVTVGDISLSHDKVNYINGYSRKEER